MLPSHLDYGWFDRQDLNLVLRIINQHSEPGSFVIVGGQSVVAWAIYYDVDVPIEPGHVALTSDLDLQAPIAQARWLAEQLGAEYCEAPMESPVNVATLTLLNHDATAKLGVDILRFVYDLDSTIDVRKWAVAIVFGDFPPAYVLHPVYVLQSRLENLHSLPSKQNPNGIAQAHVAARVIHEHLIRQDPSKAVKELRKIAEIVWSPAGVHCYAVHGVDPLAGLASWIAQDRYARDFHWPQIMRKVGYKRAVAQRRLERREESHKVEPPGEAPSGP